MLALTPRPSRSRVASVSLPAGSWVIQASVQICYPGFFDGFDGSISAQCELRRAGTAVIGGAVDDRFSDGRADATLPLNGGVVIAGGNVNVDVWCQSGQARATAQMVAIQVGGFL